MKHDAAIKAMDHWLKVRSADDTGRIVALGQYDTADCHDHERRHPCNRRGWALVAWDSGVRAWTPLEGLSQ